MDSVRIDVVKMVQQKFEGNNSKQLDQIMSILGKGDYQIRLNQLYKGVASTINHGYFQHLEHSYLNRTVKVIKNKFILVESSRDKGKYIRVKTIEDNFILDFCAKHR